MATYFVRRIPTEGHLAPIRLPSSCHVEARDLPAHHRARFLASRSLLTELVFMLYGISALPEIATQTKGKPIFCDKNLPGFSTPHAGNIVGVVLITKGTCGLDMELQQATRGFHNLNSVETQRFSSNENLWADNQNDPNEARTQLTTLRQDVPKLTGDMYSDDPRKSQLLLDAGRPKYTHVAQVEAICDAEDILVWSVAVTPTIERLKVWESDGKRDWKGLPDIQARASESTGRLIRSFRLYATKSHTL